MAEQRRVQSERPRTLWLYGSTRNPRDWSARLRARVAGCPAGRRGPTGSGVLSWAVLGTRCADRCKPLA